MTIFKTFDKEILCDEMEMISENMTYVNKVLSNLKTHKEFDTTDIDRCVSIIKNVKGYADSVSTNEYNKTTALKLKFYNTKVDEEADKI